MDDDTDVEWIPIEWHSLLHSLETVGDRIKSITLPTCSMIRSVCNDILSDVVYYFTAYHGQAIQNIIASLLNEKFQEFMISNPDFGGKVCIFAHSLGGVIAYDLLANQPLEKSPSIKPLSPKESHHGKSHSAIEYPELCFRPDILFTMGSPIGAVLVQRNQRIHDYQLPEPTKFFNIFNLHDPIAYRVEPLIDPRFLEVSPVLLQRPSKKGGDSFSWYKEFVFAYLPDLTVFI